MESYYRVNRKIIITAAASGLIFFMLGACIFSKNKEAASAIQLLQLLAQATNCWISAGSTATTTCSIGIGGVTPNANTKLAVNGRISSSVLGVYCAKTASTYNGAQVGGYTGAKAKCETACGSTSAHMCSSHELIVSYQLGISIENGSWYSAYHCVDQAGSNICDCEGWAGTTEKGPITTFTKPNITNCSSALPIACCL